MSPNGRRFWRSWAKSYRRWLNRDDRRRYRDLYDDEPLVKHQYTWFEAKKQFGPGLLCSKAKPLAPRSLVGMTQGARKRRWAKDYDALPPSGRASKTVSMLRAYGVFPKDGNPLAQRIRPCPGCCACRSHMLTYRELRRWYPTAERRYLRSFVTRKSWLCGSVIMDEGDLQTYHLSHHCDGSGVLPSRKQGDRLPPQCLHRGVAP